MFNYIKKIFDTTNKKNKKEKDNSNLIIFSIDEFMQCKISVEYNSKNTKCAENFGKLLYSINQGNIYEDKILETLINLSKANPILVPTIQETLTSWGVMIITKVEKDQNEYSDVPYIKPTSVFTNNSTQ
jgi:hypothetical protein